MAANFTWNGAAAQRLIEQQAGRRIDAACIYLSGVIKADISQPGTLRFAPPTKSGKPGKRQKTIYNFTHSLPGNPPYKQTGHLRRSITWERRGLVGRVGTNLEYGRALELGTAKMAARPFILPAFMKHQGTLRAIIGGTITPGGIPEIQSNQSRSGVLGRGAIEAGYI